MQKAEGQGASHTDDERYRLLIEAVTDYAIYMLDPDGVITSWNPGAKRFKGYEAHEIIGQNFARFYAPEDQRRGLPQRGLETARREGKFEAEGWRVRKDGTRFWAHVLIDPIRRPDGSIVGYAKITRDLTERKQAEEALRTSEEQFRMLVDGVTDYAIYLLDPDGNVANWNAGAQRIKGYLPQEIIGQHFSRFYTPEDRERGEPQRALATALRDGKFEKEGLRVRKDGTRFWANVVIDPIRAFDGRLVGFAKITRDVTERKTAERNLEIARDALFHSQKMDAIGQLTGGVAHDFNNLLSAVLGSLELLRRRLPEDPKNFRLIDNAIDAARRGAVLTQRMLAFARRQELELTPLSLETVVADMMGLLQSSLGPSVKVETRFPQGLHPVLADQNQLELSILNLVVNARDAMPAGGTIVIGARTATMDGVGAEPCVVLSVADDGEGMSAETLQRALEPFFTTKGVGKGTGLGLSMVHGMAQQLGGKFVLESKLGEGTTAEIWLPLAQAGTHAAVSTAAIDSEQTHTRRLVILAVDDDDLVLLNTSAMLEDLGHKVLEARSGKEALEIVSLEKSIDLVITDQAMPEMTGMQLAEAIRSELPELPIILATGYAELPPGSKLQLPKLAKPFMQQELKDSIAAVVAAHARGETRFHS